MTALERLRWKRKMNHQCADCGLSVHVGFYCSDCRLKANLRFQKRYLLTRLRYVVERGILTRQEILSALPRRTFLSNQPEN